jgi:hypothetical protein
MPAILGPPEGPDDEAALVGEERGRVALEGAARQLEAPADREERGREREADGVAPSASACRPNENLPACSLQ